MEQLIEKRLFVQPDPVQSRASIESHADMDTSMIISPDGKVKAEATQQKIVTLDKEAKPAPEYRY